LRANLYVQLCNEVILSEANWNELQEADFIGHGHEYQDMAVGITTFDIPQGEHETGFPLAKNAKIMQPQRNKAAGIGRA
jgi:hypothetical protein